MTKINTQTILKLKDGNQSELRVYRDFLLEQKVGDLIQISPNGLDTVDVRSGKYQVESRYDFLFVNGIGTLEEPKDLLERKYVLNYIASESE